MNTLIVYESIHHKNTEKVTMRIARILNAKVTKPENIDTSEFEEYQLIGFGSGIYWGKHSAKILQLVDGISRVEGKKAFIYSTSGLRPLPIFHDFNKPLQDKLLAKGFEIIGVFSCRGYDSNGLLRLFGGINKGRPSEKDLAEAEKFAEKIKEKIKGVSHSSP